MMFKTLLIACFVAGTLADLPISTWLEDMLLNYCDKNSANHTVGVIISKISMQNFENCMKGLNLNIETMAVPHGAPNEVLKKYCDKSPGTKTCLKKFISDFTPCLPKDVVSKKSAIDENIDQLMDFVCDKAGDWIAKFDAEIGPQCFNLTGAGLQKCINKMDLEDYFNMTRGECAKYDELTKFSVDAMKKCSSQTPANMVASMLYNVRKTFKCSSSPGSASGIAVTSATLICAYISTLLI